MNIVTYFRPYELGVYLQKFRSVPEMARDHSGRILGGIMDTIGEMLNDSIGKNGGCIMIIVLIWEYLE